MIAHPKKLKNLDRLFIWLCGKLCERRQATSGAVIRRLAHRRIKLDRCARRRLRDAFEEFDTSTESHTTVCGLK